MPFWEWYILIGLLLAGVMLALLAKEIWVNLAEKTKAPAPAKAFQSYGLIVLVTTALWPLFVPFILYEKWSSWRNDKQRRSEERVFAPTPTDLLTRLSVEEIEATEIILDPLGAAPQLPFGHLNEAWRRFRANLPLGAELWSYAVVWENRWRAREQREGYVAVVSGEIGIFFENVSYRI
jgi:hypothetical protein